MADPTPDAPPGDGRSRYLADFLASLVVFMVALPLCIAIAKASGLPPEAGIVSGIVGGIIVGLLSGSPLSVSGPAAGLIVIAYDLVKTLGPEGFGLALVIAGIGQLIAAWLRLGVWFRAVSPAVVAGMLAGIGVIIIGKQFHVMFDREAPEKIIEALAAIPATVRAAPAQGELSGPLSAGLIGLISLLVMILWKPLAPGRLKILPAAVVAVVAATAVVQATGWQAATIEFGGLSGWIASDPIIPAPDFELLTNPHLWSAVIVLALIASAETLLCCTAVDSKHTGPRTRYNRELMSQGVGNMVCGAVAALPLTAVIVRSSANIDAGARTRLSSVLHGVWLLLFALLLPDALRLIPVAALAGVLVYTGWKLLELPQVVRFWKESKGEVLVYVITATAIVMTDLLTGVLIGVAVAAARLLRTFAKLSIRTEIDPPRKRVDVHLDGAATFLNIPQLAEALEAVPRAGYLHIHIEGLRLVDHAVLELLLNFQKQYESTGGKMFIDWDHMKARFRTPELAKPAGPPGANGEAEHGHPNHPREREPVAHNNGTAAHLASKS